MSSGLLCFVGFVGLLLSMLSWHGACCRVVEVDASSKKGWMLVKMSLVSLNDVWEVSKTNIMGFAKLLNGSVVRSGEKMGRRSILGQKKIALG